MLTSLSLDLCKTFCTNLRSKDDNTREDAIMATLALGRQCSDQAAVRNILSLNFE